MTDSTCTIDGCESPIQSRGWCRMHYFRWYRNGDPGEAKPRQRATRSTECEIDGCNNPDYSAGLCGMHATRKKRHGDPEYVKPVSERNLARGAANSKWRDNPTYADIHQRLRRYKGRASDRTCVDCGKPARHWSYDHKDDAERVCDMGIPYSINLDHYHPRCVSCHKFYDLKAR